MKKIKKVKLKQAIQNPYYSIKAGTTGDSLGEELDFHFKGNGCGELYSQDYMEDHPDWFEITYEPEFKVGDWVKVVRKVTGRSNDYQNIWIVEMDKFIGQVCEIIEVDHTGIKLRSDECKWTYRFPPESLELTEKPVEKKKVVYEIEYELYEGETYPSIEDAFIVRECLLEKLNACKNIIVKKL